jgi:cytochrome oxidase Cu insertion factor (SCO1/SenC/PrrC family)
MLPIRLASLIFFLLTLSIVPSYAQLGPKDGENLPLTDLERVKAGDIAPDFTLENLDGRRISLSDFRNKKNVVLVFYRGQW